MYRSWSILNIYDRRSEDFVANGDIETNAVSAVLKNKPEPKPPKKPARVKKPGKNQQ
jgi:hypothetical protein